MPARPQRALALLVTLLAGCGEVAAVVDDPYGGDGKADARSAFFEAGRLYEFEIRDLDQDEVLAQLGGDGWSETAVAKGDAELRFRAPDARREYDDFEVRRFVADSAARPTFEIRLDDGHRLAGSRTLHFVPDDGLTGLRAQVTTRLLHALEVATPQVASATLVLDGEPLGLYLLVEHDGGRFLDDRFSEDDGERYLVSDLSSEEPAVALLERRLAGARLGPRVFGSVLDVPAFLGLVAARSAAGREIAPDARTELFNACKKSEPCFAPIVHGAEQALLAETPPLLAARPSGDDGVLGAIARLMQNVPTFRERHAELLERAERCFALEGCAGAALVAHAAMLDAERERLAAAGAAPLPAGALDDVQEWVAARREIIAGFLERELTMDAPDGFTDYAPAMVDEAGDLIVQYRHFGERHARAVHLVRVGHAAVAMTFDRDANVWRAALGPVSDAFEYVFEVELDDGTVETRLDPASRAQANGRSLLDVGRVDAPMLVREAAIDVREPSGLAWWHDHLAVVSDQDELVYFVDPDSFAVTGSVELEGPWEGAEGIAVDPLHEQMIIAFEEDAVVAWFDSAGEAIDHEGLGWADDANSGIEGVGFRSWDGMLFLAKEKEPSRIALWDDSRTEVERTRTSIASDLSDVAWSEDDGCLYVVSQEDQTLLRVGEDLEIVRAWPLGLEGLEGISVREGRLFAVSDTEGRMYELELNRWRY